MDINKYGKAYQKFISSYPETHSIPITSFNSFITLNMLASLFPTVNVLGFYISS